MKRMQSFNRVNIGIMGEKLNCWKPKTENQIPTCMCVAPKGDTLVMNYLVRNSHCCQLLC